MIIASPGTPKSAIARNIVSVVKRAVPWSNPQEATPHQLGNMRFELRTVGEACSARRVAAAWKVRVLGFDETTKNQEPALTSNVQIQEGRSNAAHHHLIIISSSSHHHPIIIPSPSYRYDHLMIIS